MLAEPEVADEGVLVERGRVWCRVGWSFFSSFVVKPRGIYCELNGCVDHLWGRDGTYVRIWRPLTRKNDVAPGESSGVAAKSRP